MYILILQINKQKMNTCLTLLFTCNNTFTVVKIKLSIVVILETLKRTVKYLNEV